MEIEAEQVKSIYGLKQLKTPINKPKYLEKRHHKSQQIYSFL